MDFDRRLLRSVPVRCRMEAVDEQPMNRRFERNERGHS